MPSVNWNETTIQAVWEKGQPVSGYDRDKYRQDACSAWMSRVEYGNRNSTYGWEVDHDDPNGGDYLSNLQPLQWANNVAEGDGPLKCAVRSSGNGNVRA
jgi:hypothetical protein